MWPVDCRASLTLIFYTLLLLLFRLLLIFITRTPSSDVVYKKHLHISSSFLYMFTIRVAIHWWGHFGPFHKHMQHFFYKVGMCWIVYQFCCFAIVHFSWAVSKIVCSFPNIRNWPNFTICPYFFCVWYLRLKIWGYIQFMFRIFKTFFFL